jgi:hypothetical protein
VTKLLHEVDPREQDGRDAVARFKAQYRAAAYHCLSILSGGDVDAVFCDIHDDFVVRKNSSGSEKYDFYQVKTKNKKGFQWGLGDVYGINKTKDQDRKKIVDSFVGKLMLHTILFGDSCRTVSLQSNKDFDEAVYEIQEAFAKGTIDQKHPKHFFSFFKDIHPNANAFSEEEIKASLAKLRLEGASTLVEIDGGNFLALSRQAILDYAEFDMQYIEFKEIAIKLLNLVEDKSVGRISEISDTTIRTQASISLDDVLNVMAISPSGYKHLRNGGDILALRNTSIIQRVLKQGGAPPELIESCCKCKSEFDIWLASARHYVSEPDFQMFSLEINNFVTKWLENDGNLMNLLKTIKSFTQTLNNSFSKNINDNVCMGAFLAEIVRQKT